MSEASQGAIYPRYCFHRAPTFNTWCLLRAAEIHHLAQHAGFEGENFFFYRQLPIKWVRIVGVIVAVDEYPGRRIFTVDDSSGACIEATVTVPVAKVRTEPNTNGDTPTTDATTAKAPAPPHADIEVGAVVDVKGGLSTFREEKQIKIEKIVRLRSTAQELALWEKMARFRRDVLDKPWVLRNRDIRRCRKEAERSEEEVERKKRRLKAAAEHPMGKARAKHTKEALEPTGGKEAKPTDRAKETGSSHDLTAIRLRELIQAGGASGKYSALGL